ncbi:GNAT family N-acetyltransferase [Kitasatospora sp. NPDC096147]|uniref:GNAT family N-acetyltransferase n=1 Tax=Kitasatospora sp. NPDC096147 TaxID=3364093 RepID=UPI0037F9AD9B
MTDLGVTDWPPTPLRTERLVLRGARPGDRAAFVELLASPQVYEYLGGARPRAELEAAVPEAPGQRPGLFVVELDGKMIGTVTVDRRAAGRPGRVGPAGGDAELSYLLLPHAWGRGYATEACTAVLQWTAAALPGEPVVLCTQSANARSVRLAEKLGFAELERFEEFGADQWFGVRHPRLPAA